MNKAFTSLVSAIGVIGTTGSLAVNADLSKNENKVDGIENNNSLGKDEPSKLEKVGRLVGQIGGCVILGLPTLYAAFTVGGVGAIVGGGGFGVSVLSGLALGGLSLYLIVKGCGALGGYIGKILNDILF